MTCCTCVRLVPKELLCNAMNVPNRYHHSKKTQKPKLKPQAKRARRAALKALKHKLAV